MTEIEVEFRVRWYQQRFHRALVERTHDRLMAVWHRRAGKDEILLNAFATLSDIDIGTYWHCFPEYKQARKAIWNGINAHTGQRRIFDHFPPPTIKRMQDDDMFLELHSGSTFQLLGSDRYDATVGSGPRGIGYSEWALSNPSAWAYHSPMIRETNGWAAFITTPRGNNHAKTMFDRAKGSDAWFVEMLNVHDTGALTPADLEEALHEYEDLYGREMGLAFFEQEYECSWSGAMVGSIFGAEMNRAERDGRVRPVEIDRRYPVHTVMDMGKAVNNPIWCFQTIPGELGPRVVDFYRPDSDDLEEWCAWLDDKGYNGTDYVPPDAVTGLQWGTKRTRIEMLKLCKRKPKVIAVAPLQDGINAGNTTIRVAVFHGGDDDRAERVALGIEGVKNYRREWDDDLKRFRDNPVKDWAEHIGSATRYLGLAWREEKIDVKPAEKPKELEYVATPQGIRGNMDVKAAVDAMVRRRRGEE